MWTNENLQDLVETLLSLKLKCGHFIIHQVQAENCIKWRCSSLCRFKRIFMFFFFFFKVLCFSLLSQVYSRSGSHSVSTDRGQDGHCVPQGRCFLWGKGGVLQSLPGLAKSAGELHHWPDWHASAELRQTKPWCKVHVQVSGIQPQLVGSGVPQGEGLLHNLWVFFCVWSHGCQTCGTRSN